MLNGFEELCPLLDRIGDTEYSLSDLGFLWKLASQGTGTIVELASNSHVATVVLAATGRRVVSISNESEADSAISQFVQQHDLWLNIEFRQYTDGISGPIADVGAIVLHLTGGVLEASRQLLHLWDTVADGSGRQVVIAVKKPLDCVEDDGNFLGAFLDCGAATLGYEDGSWSVAHVTGFPPAKVYVRVAVGLREEHDRSGSLAMFTEALSLDQDDADCWHEYARTLMEDNRLEEAEEACRRSLECCESHHVLNSLAMALLRQGRGDEAIPFLRRALRLKPDYVHALNSLGWAYEDVHDLKNAERLFRKCIDVAPDYPHGQYNLGRTCLMLGKLEEGWSRYEWRWRLERFPSIRREYPYSRWAGEPLSGRSILIWAEQGIGDQIAFVSMLPDIIRRGGTGVLECSEKLVPLFSQSFPEFDVVPFLKRKKPHGQISERTFDFEISLGSLGGIIRRSDEDFPAEAGYLKPSSTLVAHWHERILQLGDSVKVGLAWKSGNTKGARGRQYLSLDDLEPVLKVEGCTFVCVQYGNVEQDIDEARRRYGVEIQVLDGLDLFDDVESTVAMTASLDFGVSPLASYCTDVMAVNDIPVSSFKRAPTERSLGRDGTAWFPSVTAFQCGRHASPKDAVEAIAASLQAFVEDKASRRD